jgi:16S rRNA U516 pseudouridylate synthase RsuA-like enzyme
MMEAVDNKITALERLTFGPLALDGNLERGAWRMLTEDEERELLVAANRKDETERL